MKETHTHSEVSLHETAGAVATSPNEWSDSFIAYSESMKLVKRQAEKVARVSSTVLLIGESGVGKEVIAKHIHCLGPRCYKPFIKVNCGAIPENLLESELFGYKKGAFTGADPNGKTGYFTQANEGIIFLDEVTEMSLHLQVKLLRVIQEREVVPLGGGEPIKLDLQIIAATNKNIESLVEEGHFREDLYYRLNVVPIHIPPLRERPDDIPFLTHHFLSKFNQKYKRNVSFTPDVYELLKHHPWYGNIRELENKIERIVVTTESSQVDSKVIAEFITTPKSGGGKPHPHVTKLMPLQEALEVVEEQLIAMAMEQYKSINLAAKALQISQPTMSRKYQKLREKRERARSKSGISLERRQILENELDKQLRSISIVLAASLNVDSIKALANDISAENPHYLKLQSWLTMIREQEGEIEWGYIWITTPDNRVINLVADKKLDIKPGQEYKGPPEMMNSVFEGMKGKIVISPKYCDMYGEWKSSIAPIKDQKGQVIAVLGVDFSVEYIDTQIEKLDKLLKK
jgi:DNA-binding NtrC family response regulator